MPSIFIWKSNTPNNSKKTIRYYTGSNWVLEDNEYSSKSYIYLGQKVITVSNLNDSVIIYKTKNMPQDWVGSELLEVIQINYDLVKQDNFGTLERIGSWFRFTLNNENISEEETANKIYSWMNENKKEKNIKTNNSNNFNNSSKNKYIKKQYNNDYKKHNTHITTIENMLNPNTIQQNFQEFLIKYSVPITSPSIHTYSKNNI